MVRALLVRGMVAGAAAGLLAWLFSNRVGAPGIEGGIAFEERAARAAGESHGVELVGRGIQSTIGLGVAVTVFGIAVGGLFGLVYAVAYGRLGSLSPRATAAVLAAGAFVVVFLVPFLKYPANPPGVNAAATIGTRTGLYVGVVVVSILLAVGAVQLARRVAARAGGWNGGLLGAATYAGAAVVVLLTLPAAEPPPAGFPADVLYGFRLASVGNQLVLWAAIGLLFGALTERSLRRRATSLGAAP